MGSIITKRTEELLGPLNHVEKKYAPKEIFLKGNIQLFEAGPRVSVVGSRNPSKLGKEDAAKIVSDLLKNEVVIVSGLAEGIDTVAHKTAVNKGGSTIAVLGTPLDACYPPQNRELQQTIMEKHLAISQFPGGSSIQKINFPLRNRTMALISHATIIVEAGETSGTIHQGWEALRLGRPLFIADKLIIDPALSWPKKMREYGAIAFSPASIEKVLEFLPASENAMAPYSLI